MDWHEVAVGLIGLLVLAYGVIFHRIVKDQTKLEQRMSEHKADTDAKLAELPDKYVRRDDLSEWKQQVLQTLNRIEQKLDSKVDKP